MTLTGNQLKDMLEQQWLDPKRPRILQVSNGFSYTWDASKPFGERVIPAKMTLNGRLIEPGNGYRVTLNDYLAVGGDGFSVAKQGTAPQYGGYDADALFAFFRAHGPVGPLPPTRILRVN
ncbi:2',3'-cyclic-nucleotide 2'-phosphodiesterase (5'-nucleotidase family) [Bradyrhizobium liaoningense]